MSDPFDTRENVRPPETPVPTQKQAPSEPQISEAVAQVATNDGQALRPSEAIMSANAARQVIQHCTFGAVGIKLRPGSYAVSNLPGLKVTRFLKIASGRHERLPWLMYQDHDGLCLVVARDHTITIDAKAHSQALESTFAEAGYRLTKIDEVEAEPAELHLLASFLRDMPKDREALFELWNPGGGRQVDKEQVFAMLQSELHIQSVRQSGGGKPGWRALRGRRGWEPVESADLHNALDQIKVPNALEIPVCKVPVYPFEDISAGLEASAVEALYSTAMSATGACIIGGGRNTGGIVTAASVANFAAGTQGVSACAVGVDVDPAGATDWLRARTIDEAAETDAGVILWATGMGPTTGAVLAKLVALGKLVVVSLFSASLVQTIEALMESGATAAVFTQSVKGVFQQIRVPLLCPDCALPDDRDKTLEDLGFISGVSFNAKRRGVGFCTTCGGHHVLRDAHIIEALVPTKLDRNNRQSIFVDRNVIDADQAVIAKNRLWVSGLSHYVLRGEMDIDDLRRFTRRYG
jgi:hypothetical protein